jgi:hypothetical protein
MSLNKMSPVLLKPIGSRHDSTWTGPPAALNFISITLHILIKVLNFDQLSNKILALPQQIYPTYQPTEILVILL